MFDWQNSNLEETTQHILKSSYAAVSRARKYYADRDKLSVVLKIDAARMAAKKERLRLKLEAM
jgi:hypothetical protein